ncbi:helix-turn-helix domain-containing protein [Pseudoalteromonas sp. JBTF-M23]|uniref:Helix-turn-helix domain-containing protein n=1 Tax=Pseudoalteromonas caenipelagi TaxID=2726988 RepID=A0A849V874_9GAMM|nr:helix-turn-helix domain-containing protein [Pseudoalteromonas caenipelagi]NOU49416.1 helix-turn-helix domain-containing protein [Pseudoalteromonas caenipelagi]
MDIGEAAKRSNLPASTLRYYEEKGLIKSIGRNGLKRVFANDIVEKLAFISLGRIAGLSLDEIKQMLLHGNMKVNRSLLLSKADEIEAQINQLTLMQDSLRHAANCPSTDHFECPKFIKLLKLATGRWNKSRR